MGEEEAAREGATARGGHGHLGLATAGPHHLALAGNTPELRARLVEEAVPVQAAGRELTAVGVERE
ncbi:MAG: hypothetical protein QOF97_1624, partial [Acidimicrobiaceae bacterium]